MLIAIIIAFLSLIALMVIHEYGHFIIAKKFGVKVEEFGIGYPPRIFGKKIGETIYSINWIPLGAFVRIHGEEGGVDDYRSFSNLAIWKRMLIVLGGVLAFWITSIILFSFVFLIGAEIPIGHQEVSEDASVDVRVVEVLKDSLAEEIGLMEGDKLISLKGNDSPESAEIKISEISQFQELAENYKGLSVNLKINRQGEELDILAEPRAIYPENEGPFGIIIERFLTVIEKAPWYLAPVKGLAFTGDITWQAMQGIYGIFANLFGGSGLPEGAEFAGPVGITIFLARATNFGLGFFLYFIASISVFIALFNLFPVPALDGGKFVFLIIEKFMGKPIPVKVEQVLTVVFFFVLISAAIFVTIKFDVPRVIDLWKASIY